MEWIPIKTRLMTPEERIEYSDYYGIEYCDTCSEVMFDCPMPEDGQEILVCYEKGYVDPDICSLDVIGGLNAYFLEKNGDWGNIVAWMPFPEPYKVPKEDKKNDN